MGVTYGSNGKYKIFDEKLTAKSELPVSTQFFRNSYWLFAIIETNTKQYRLTSHHTVIINNTFPNYFCTEKN